MDEIKNSAVSAVKSAVLLYFRSEKKRKKKQKREEKREEKRREAGFDGTNGTNGTVRHFQALFSKYFAVHSTETGRVIVLEIICEVFSFTSRRRNKMTMTQQETELKQRLVDLHAQRDAARQAVETARDGLITGQGETSALASSQATHSALCEAIAELEKRARSKARPAMPQKGADNEHGSKTPNVIGHF